MILLAKTVLVVWRKVRCSHLNARSKVQEPWAELRPTPPELFIQSSSVEHRFWCPGEWLCEGKNRSTATEGITYISGPADPCCTQFQGGELRDISYKGQVLDWTQAVGAKWEAIVSLGLYLLQNILTIGMV